MKLFLLIALLASSVATEAQVLINPYRFGIPSLTANTAVFDGTGDLLKKTTAITGIADGQAFTMSFWMKADVDGTLYRIFYITTSTTPSRFRVFRTVGNTIEMVGNNVATTTVLEATTAATVTAAMGWTHVYIAIDLSNTSNRHIYINGTEDASVTWTTYNTAGVIDFDATLPQSTIGSDGAEDGKLAGALAELWFDDSYFNDPTKFRNAANHPISLGATGNTPTGAAPVLYLSLNGAGNSWATDSSGNANTFTVTGTLGTTTSP